MCGDFLEQRRVQRLGVYRCFMKKKNVVLNRAQINVTKTASEPISIEKCPLKATMSQRHNNYYGFEKTGFKNKQFYYPRNNMTYVEKMECRCHVCPHSILEGCPKSTIVKTIQNKIRKRRSKKRL